MQAPDWITHHITVVALYVCVHACVWRRGGRNRACRIKKVQRVQNGQDDEKQKRNWTCGDETEITSGRWRQPNSQREKEMGLPIDVSINIHLCWDPLFLIHSPLIKTSAVIQFYSILTLSIYIMRGHINLHASRRAVFHIWLMHMSQDARSKHLNIQITGQNVKNDARALNKCSVKWKDCVVAYIQTTNSYCLLHFSCAGGASFSDGK